MGEKGLAEVTNPSGFFLAERPRGAAGSVIVSSLEGSRPLLLELQALVTPASFGTPRRTVLGADYNRVCLLLAVLEKRVGFPLQSQDVFVNVAGGGRVTEPAVDLGVIVAAASSYLDRPVRGDAVIMGEVGLAGEVRAVAGLPARLKEAAALGFTAAVVPQNNLTGSNLAREATHPIDVQGVGSVDEAVKALDTSVIIDGRVVDLCEVGFLEGTLVVPQFVLRELQQIADSPDSLKRNRGKRGFDVLQRLQRVPGTKVRIEDQDFPHVREVDRKLIELGKVMGAKVVTNDYNLNKVAELSGVSVLNVNELANALKPVVLPGEVVHVQVVKEGKEVGQGVAYLDDGTMVVVDHGKRLIGQQVSATVTSVLQTTAGRMIFARLKEEEGVAR